MHTLEIGDTSEIREISKEADALSFSRAARETDMSKSENDPKKQVRRNL